jgi:hypothetical protein
MVGTVVVDPVVPVTTEVELWTVLTLEDGIAIEVGADVVTGFPVADCGTVKLSQANTTNRTFTFLAG